MQERSLPASPNWYCSRCSDVSTRGLLGVGAKNLIYLIDVSVTSCRVVGELVGHKDVVSGFSFCRHEGRSHLCVSSSHDGVVRLWDADARSLLSEHDVHQAPVVAVHWSAADADLVASGDERGVVACHWRHTGATSSFRPEPRSITCLTCSPHTWSTVAVGYKDGMIVLLDLSRSVVTHRLRGHDDEIHALEWAPLAGEYALYACPEGGDGGGDGHVTSAAGEGGCYLASGSRDQTLRVWSSAQGKGVMTLKLPHVKKRGAAVDPGVKERLWLTVHWPEGRPTQLVSSCFSGELLLWDLTRSGKQKWVLFGGAGESQNHTRIVFNVSSLRPPGGGVLLLSTSMDRLIRCWDLDSLSSCWALPTLGGFVYALSFSPVGAGFLALGVGDHMIRVWNTLSPDPFDVRTLWQGIRSKVTALAWHPQKEGALSFGTDDGKVGVYDVFSNKPPQISSSYHKRTVYSLAWGPPVPPAGGGTGYTLYSCAGEGVVLQHDPTDLSGDASDINRLIQLTNDIQHKLPPHTDLSWKPDGTVVAIGNEDGCVEVYAAPTLALRCSIQQHHKTINALAWSPAHAAPPQRCLLASASSNAVVYVHDLRAAIETPPARPPMLTEPYRRLSGHTAKVTGLAWSPHHDARLVTVSYDGTAQVWDVLQEAPLANYRGHAGPLLCVEWSPLDPDLVWTGGRDFTLQEWRVSQQEFSRPPKGKKMLLLKEKAKKKKNKVGTGGAGPGAGGAGPGTGEVNGESGSAGAKVSGDEEEEEEEGSSASGPVAPAAVETHRKPSSSSVTKIKETPDAGVMKRRKPRSLLPISSSLDHRSREELLQDCVALATVTHGGGAADSVPDLNLHLGLFSDRSALLRMLEAEEAGHVEAGHYDSVVYLRLWTGDLEGALQLAAERGELNDHLLSLAPMAGFGAWRGAVEAYVRQLSQQEQHLKAASHLLSLHRVTEALELLGGHRLYREAVALAKARLPPGDPVLGGLYRRWAGALEKDGHLSAAAKCYLAAGAGFDAAKVLAKKNDAASLRAAAQLARVCGEAELARALALRCTKELTAALDWVAAQEVLSAQDGLLVHRLHLCVAELLEASLSDAVGAPQHRFSSHPWASPAEPQLRLRDRVIGVWAEQFGVSSTSTGSHAPSVLLQELKSVETPPPSASVPLKQVQLYSALHLSRALLVWLGDDDGLLMAELWGAAAWFQLPQHFSAGAQLCRLLFPEGDVSVWSRTRPLSLHPPEEDAAASLQALVQYHHLYARWWRSSAPPSLSGGVTEEEQGVSVATVWAGPLDASLLLSRPHATLQATQVSVREIQDLLAAMVLQHGRADAPLQATPTGEEGATLVSLSARMAAQQEQLDQLPDAVKAFPRPDVMECCLLLLHLSRTAPVPEPVQQEARELLQRFGTHPDVQRAARRFLS
ncbi:gem-associated protein 5 [Antennarius striatus]|uniref:gem-associated protein 5 n=1 Tax=Antennarius striatus TaxID=241820 RepID=UPI0035B164F3